VIADTFPPAQVVSGIPGCAVAVSAGAFTFHPAHIHLTPAAEVEPSQNDAIGLLR